MDPRLTQSARNSRRGGFNQDKREFELDKVIQSSARSPGPGEYTAVGPRGKGAIMQPKREVKIATTPGPGTYDLAQADERRRPQTGKNQVFGNQQRPDLWQQEKSKSTLGPAYETKGSFDTSGKKGATFGVKRTQKVSDTPGPGQYTNADVISMVKSKGASVRIGQTKRADNFASKTIDLPGPGNY